MRQKPLRRMGSAMSAPLRTFAIATALAAGMAIMAGPAAAAGTSPRSPWSQTNYDSAQSRANLTEDTLTRATVTKVSYLRSLVAPLDPPPQLGCATDTVVTPVLTGGAMYAVASGRLTNYNPATGAIIWRHRLTAGLDGTSLDNQALSVAKGLVVIGENSCGSASDPNGFIQAFTATTGALKWSKPISPGGGALGAMVVSGAFVAAAGSSPGGGNVVSVPLQPNLRRDPDCQPPRHRSPSLEPARPLADPTRQPRGDGGRAPVRHEPGRRRRRPESSDRNDAVHAVRGHDRPRRGQRQSLCGLRQPRRLCLQHSHWDPAMERSARVGARPGR